MATEKIDEINKWVDYIEEQIHQLYDEKSGKPCFYSVEFNILSSFFKSCFDDLTKKGFTPKEAKEMENEIMEKIYKLENYHKECPYRFNCVQCPVGGLSNL